MIYDTRKDETEEIDYAMMNYDAMMCMEKGEEAASSPSLRMGFSDQTTSLWLVSHAKISPRGPHSVPLGLVSPKLGYTAGRDSTPSPRPLFPRGKKGEEAPGFPGPLSI